MNADSIRLAASSRDRLCGSIKTICYAALAPKYLFLIASLVRQSATLSLALSPHAVSPLAPSESRGADSGPGSAVLGTTPWCRSNARMRKVAESGLRHSTRKLF